MKTENVLRAAALALALALAPNLAQAGKGNVGNPGVAPPQSSSHGQNYSAWAAAWWQWAFSMPVSQNALFDETGALVSLNQSGPLWFLGGVFNETGSATRTATIPPGKALLFPILNYVIVSTPGDPPWDEPYTDPVSGITYPNLEAYFRAVAKGVMDGATDLACEVDGLPLQNIAAYREESIVFNVTLPDDNLFGLPAGTYGPGIDDGYYLLLAPLPAGKHTIHFHGSMPGFTLDITYNLTVLK
jgi:hypothetical protein